jgi:hypothetical protein
MAYLTRKSGISRVGAWVKRDAWRAQIAVLHALLLLSPPSAADEAFLTGNEQKLKVAFIYNFALFTEWPAEVGSTLNLCIHGPDPFGNAIDELQGKAVDRRSIMVQRKGAGDSLKGCQAVFVTGSAIGGLPSVLDEVRDHPVLTIADSPGAAQQGVAINMAVTQNKVTFEVNLRAARAARLSLSSKLLRVATEVFQ